MDRRPIAARKATWAIRLAEVLAARGASANAISVWGMIAGIASGLALASTNQATGLLLPLAWLGGAALVGLRLLANMLDGMVAERRGICSPVGSLYNEVPDRVSDVATLLGLGYALGSDPIFGWAASLLAVLTAYVRAQVAVSGAPQDFRGPMAKPHRMTVVIIAAVVAAAGFHDLICRPALAVIAIGSAITAWRRLTAGAGFLEKGTA
jgi:phosphatidylglycerophosphate synthase